MDSFSDPLAPDPPDAVGTWLLHRVADAVENREVSADLLTGLHAAMAEVRARPPEARATRALIELAERVHLPVDYLMELLAAVQAQPTAVRERFLRRLVEAWLVHQREAYDADHRGGDDGEDAGSQASRAPGYAVLAQAFPSTP